MLKIPDVSMRNDCIGIFLNTYLPNYLQSKQHTYQTHYWQTKIAYLQKYLLHFLLTHLTKGGLAEQIIKLDSLHHFCICFSFSSPSLRENAENMYCFSSLALTLNEEDEGVCWTDSRLRTGPAADGSGTLGRGQRRETEAGGKTESHEEEERSWGL